MQAFNVFMIDPPWPKKKGGLRKVAPNQGRDLDYATLSVAEIFALLDREVFSQAQEQHTVFLWNVDEFLHAGEQEMERRGYRRHARFIWDKMNGVAPGFSIRYSHEYLTWFYKPKFVKVDEAAQGKFMTVFREKARQHSRKPEVAYFIIEQLYPQATRLDVFSRQQRDGWTAWGDQVDYFPITPT